jgi:hypothetical protein
LYAERITLRFSSLYLKATEFKRHSALRVLILAVAIALRMTKPHTDRAVDNASRWN